MKTTVSTRHRALHPRLLPLLLAGLGCLPAAAQQAAPGASAVESFIVTGTRSSKRTVAESESPIDVLTPEDLRSTGSTELATVLARLLPSLNFPRPTVTDGTDSLRPAQLRGLSPDQVLVLVDGKRRHPGAVVNVNGSAGRGSAPVDLNAIPIAAVERIEVLRDGASAQYGSDAIAGVINIILRKGAKGGFVEGGYGRFSEGDGRQASAAANAGAALGDAGYVRATLEYRDQAYTNRAGPDLRNPLEPRFGQVNQRFGDPDSTQKNALVNGAFRLSPAIEIYAFANLAQRDTSSAATWRTAYSSGTTQRSPLYPEGFLPLLATQSTDKAIVAGARGESGSWRWDASVNHGGNEFEFNVENTANLSLGAASPTRFDAGRLETTQTVLNLDVAHELAVAGWHRPLTLAFGAEWRREKYEIGAGEPASYQSGGAQAFSGFQPANAGSNDRHSEAVYANLEAELTSRASGSIALRHERYSDFGNATSAKLAGRYALSDSVALRATGSSGFRAPSLAQQNYTITTTNFIVIGGVSTPIETGTFGVNTAAARALGAQPLKAETSRNYSVGALLTPLPRLTATVDAYRIDIDDRILFSANLVLPAALQNLLASQGVFAGAARYFTNAVDTRTKGVDALVTYGVDLGTAGKLDLSGAYNYNKTTVLRVADNPAFLTANNLLLIDRQTLGRATVTPPRDKVVLGSEWRGGAWEARGALTRYGRFTVPQNNETLDQAFGATWVLDLAASWKSGNWRLTAGADNVTDRYPDEVTSAGNLNTNGIFRYSSFSPYGFNGRFYYARAAYSW